VVTTSINSHHLKLTHSQTGYESRGPVLIDDSSDIRVHWMITGSPLFTAYIVVIAQEILELGLATAFAVSLNAISLVNSAKGTILLSCVLFTCHLCMKS
jgi:hypothetical protein